MSSLLFDDVFEVNEVDPDGKKFTKGTTAMIMYWCREEGVR